MRTYKAITLTLNFGDEDFKDRLTYLLDHSEEVEEYEERYSNSFVIEFFEDYLWEDIEALENKIYEEYEKFIEKRAQIRIGDK